MRPRLSRARSRAAGAPWSCSKGDRSCRSASRSSGRDRRASRREPPSTTGSGPREARLGEFHLLRRGQPPRRSAPRSAPRPVPRPVPEPGQAFGVVAQHRVPQRLALHAREACRVRPAQTVERMGDRVHSRRRPTALLTTGRPPNAVGRQLPPDLQRSSHDHPRIPASPHPRKNRITQRSPIEPPESGHGLAGMSTILGEAARPARMSSKARGPAARGRVSIQSSVPMRPSKIARAASRKSRSV